MYTCIFQVIEKLYTVTIVPFELIMSQLETTCITIKNIYIMIILKLKITHLQSEAVVGRLDILNYTVQDSKGTQNIDTTVNTSIFYNMLFTSVQALVSKVLFLTANKHQIPT